ncbi:MAG: shikimate dehydrogenase [Lachnospiraceae bacterium]|nr:shikimate dehydrogenase [Lachnospiraceae bacterium]
MKEINGRTKVLGLIGDPVEHTESPSIHNLLAEKLGDNVVYVPFRVDGRHLEEAVEGAYALGMEGLNVTVPHKVEVMQYVTELDDAALDIGAVNTLARIRGGYRGYNTDFSGFIRELDKLDIQVNGKSVIVLGAGGAAKAVVHSLKKLRADHIYILNRSIGKAQKIFAGTDNVTISGFDDWESIPKGKYTCIQCTSVGLSPDDDACVIDDEGFYDLIESAVDLIYKPKETAFMKKVVSHGGRAYNGLRMLVYQAVSSYEFFMRKEVPEEVAEELYNELNS